MIKKIIFCLMMIMMLCGCTITDAPTNTPEPAPTEEPVALLIAEVVDCTVGIDHDENPCAMVTINWTNNSDETTSAYVSLFTQAFQNGVELERSYPDNFSEDTMYNNDCLNLRPGASIEYTNYFILREPDMTVPIEIDIYDNTNWELALISSGTYTLE